MMYKIVFISFTIVIVLGFFYLPGVHGQLNPCTIFDGNVLAVVRANNDCLGYADAKMAEGWTIVVVSNESIYMEKHGNSSQLFN
jgi:uncharacterized protein (UPF0179 family)